MSPATFPDHTDRLADVFSCADSNASAPLASQTDITSPSLSLRGSQSEEDMAVHNHGRSNCNLGESNANLYMFRNPSLSFGVYKQDDVVGQYLAARDLSYGMKGFQAPGPDYANANAGFQFQGLPYGAQYESYISRRTYQHWYPDPESIRHLHNLHSLLPHIQPERKLNALSGPEIDIIEGRTGNTICRAVPKKMLVLFLGREIVTKFLHTFQREDNERWAGLPTQQVMILPHGAASAAALRILISWMIRACKLTTMYTMKQIRLPAHLFVACSLAQTMELFNLRKDAHRVDIAISWQYLKRPIFAVEVESLWRCLDKSNKYLHACIKAFSVQPWHPKMHEELANLAMRCPELYARICNPELNDTFKPHFGREWFRKLGGSAGQLRDGHEGNVAPVLGKANAEFTVAQAGGSHTTDIGTRGMRSLDPSVPEFEPSKAWT